ncbi:MAG: S8 family serine peptidase, partial [Gemmatimonadetes bacterium]|nr:S8 family serine peptidase [Gemmatimonadota bacterium]NIS29160.1 S8 family serine peptidase [Actinomycetota bacterium]NIU68453.1 S8 family serine peptidase [Actinomycetota bacterium]NIW30280.1 S8 family serine peptidase [Actinomycetota bacterium]NIX22698.1 S8 family serine peptidase [Actinomycetota bacterium]
HEYALENGADVLNMSFSVPDLGNLRGLWRWMSEHAIAAGLVLVSGAGNFQQTEPVPVQLRTPEAIPSVIAVGGVDRDSTLAGFSSMGP